MEKQRVVVDTDYFINLTQYNNDNGALFLKIMDEMGYQPIMHKYVAEFECSKCACIDSLINDGKIIKISYDDYLLSNKDREEYEEYFRDMYERITKLDLPEDVNVFEYAAIDENLGEIRSVHMAKKLGLPIMLSDDNGSKMISKNYNPRKKLQIITVYDTLVNLKTKGTDVTYRDINAIISNVYREKHRVEKREYLKEIYSCK